jgi:RNA-directed DNA polymerase
MMDKRLLYNIFSAYELARKGKKSRPQVMLFELDREQNLIELYEDLVVRCYKIDFSTCFIYTDTVKREVFAASFRDRIVHHLVYQYLYPLYDACFIYDSYSCRNHKGTQLGRQRVDHFIRSCTQNYSRDAWILKCDIR